MENKNDLCERLFRFTIDVINFLKEIKSTPEIAVLKYQLTKSASSSGANYEESQAAISRADFKNKVSISLKEMRESNYWLRIFNELKVGDKKAIEYLMKESVELKKNIRLNFKQIKMILYTLTFLLYT